MDSYKLHDLSFAQICNKVFILQRQTFFQAQSHPSNGSVYICGLKQEA